MRKMDGGNEAPLNDPENPNAPPPIVNIDADDANPFLLAPDHYLLQPL